MNDESNTNPMVTEVTEVVIVKERSNNLSSILKGSSVGYGLLSALLVLAVGAAVAKIATLPTFIYGIPAVLSISLLIVYILAFAIAALGPAIFVGSSWGLKKALYIILCEFLWFVLLFATYYLTNPNPTMPINTFGY